MNHFLSWKSLSFYGSAIASVVVLFSVVTAYGEANLKAPRKIDGRYPLQATTLPGCLAGNTIVLDLQQSGVYLTGSLLQLDADAKVQEAAKERPTLIGTWRDQQLQLAGAFSLVPGCRDRGTLTGTIAQETLAGTLRLDSDPVGVPFTANREAPRPVSPSTH